MIAWPIKLPRKGCDRLDFFIPSVKGQDINRHSAYVEWNESQSGLPTPEIDERKEE